MIPPVDQAHPEAMAEKEIKFLELMEKLGHAFREEISEKRSAVYWERLQRYPAKKLERAMNEALDNEHRFPSIAAIRQYMEPLLDPANRQKRYPDL